MLEKIRCSRTKLMKYLNGYKIILNLIMASTIILFPGLKSAVNKYGFFLEFKM